MLRDSDFAHLPVMPGEVLAGLHIRPAGIYVDCTLGGGGHAALILERLGPDGRLIGIDQDAQARAAASARLAQCGKPGTWHVIAGNFSDLPAHLQTLSIPAVDGILADLGVSSWQLDQPERGFSYHQDGPLDMRMDQSASMTAADLVNTWPEDSITEILQQYGEERFAGRIARAIVRRRASRPFTTTADLAGLICQAMPASSRHEAQHPARRSFQALRIAVNDELGVLRQLLETAPDLLRHGGRLCVITFHSLEDRIVKQAFRTWENPCICPRDFPVCTCGRKSMGHAVSRQAIVASAAEKADNPRARSARLRCFERVRPEDDSVRRMVT